MFTRKVCMAHVPAALDSTIALPSTMNQEPLKLSQGRSLFPCLASIRYPKKRDTQCTSERQANHLKKENSFQQSKQKLSNSFWFLKAMASWWQMWLSLWDNWDTREKAQQFRVLLALAEDPRFNSQEPPEGSQPSLDAVPREQRPSSHLGGHQARGWCIDTHASKNNHTQKT